MLDEIAFNHFLTPIYAKKWAVYCKPPFKSAACVVEYLGRYTHRVAISNNRIISMKDGIVTFKWRDYKDGNQWKIMRVSAQEFIRRFLIHVLPDHFMKIRHYGFLSSRNKTTKLMLCKKLTKTPFIERLKLSVAELLLKLTGKDISRCPKCATGKMRKHSIVEKPPPLCAAT